MGNLVKDMKIRGIYLIVVIVISVLPFLLGMIGVDFGSVQYSLNEFIRQGFDEKEAMFLSMKGVSVHTILEWSAIVVALFLVIISFLHFEVKKESITPILGIALFSAGIMDCFHVLVSVRLINTVADNMEFVPFSWALSRLFNALVLIGGISIFLLSPGIRKLKGHLRPVLIIAFVFGVISATVIYYSATRINLPRTMFPDALITRPFDVAPLILFIVAGIFLFPRFHNQVNSIFSFGILLSIIPQISTELHMVFGSEMLYDHHFNIAHFMKIFAYGVPLAGLAIDYSNNYPELSSVKVNLRNLNEELEEKIERRTESLNLALSVGRIGVWDWNMETGFLDWDDSMHSLFDVPKAEFRNRFEDFARVVHPEDLKRVESDIQQSIDTDSDFSTDFRVIWKNNSTHHLKGKGKIITNPEGKAIRMIGTNMDITDIRLSEERYRNIFESVPVSIWEEDFTEVKRSIMELKTRGIRDIRQHLLDNPDLAGQFAAKVKILDVNQQTLKMFEARNKEQLLKGLDKIFIPETYPIFIEECATIAAGKRYYSSETVFRSLKGKRVHSLFSVFFPDPEGILDRVVVSRTDISDRIKQEEIISETKEKLQLLNNELEKRVEDRARELSESESRFRSLFENAAIGVALVDENGFPAHSNPALCKLLGYTEDELRKMEFAKFTYPDDIEKDVKLYGELIEGKRNAYYIEKRYIRKDKVIIWANLVVSLIRDAEGKPVYGIGMVEDITEKKKTELKINELNEELTFQVQKLEEANKELESFSYSVSHDLRAPLRSINGFSKILLEDFNKDLNEEGQRLLGIVIKNAVKMGLLIDDLLSFSRMSRLEKKNSRISMNKLAEEAIREALEDNVSPEADFKIGKLPEIYGDRNMIMQAMINLVANALKYSKDQKKQLVEIGTKNSKEEKIFYVKDNGVGFDMKYEHKLFNIFQRLHAPEEYKGTGIGLALVKRIIQRHGGRVWAEGQVNKGATFYFSLPLNHN